MNNTSQQPSIFRLKKQYKRLFLITFRNKIDIVFRLLTWGEIKLVKSCLSIGRILEEVILDDIFQDCVVHSNIEDLESIPAGIIDTVSNLIMKLSFFEGTDEFVELLNNKRLESQTLTSQIELLLSSSFGYKMEDIDKLTLDEILTVLANSEKAMSGAFPKVPLEFKKAKKGLRVGAQEAIDFNAENEAMFDAE